jgi:hypothetical protein
MKAVGDSDDWLGTSILDVGRDDYYGHAGSWWDVQDSGLLYDLDKSLDPAPDITGLTATSTGGVATVTWGIAPPQTITSYRVYDADGRLKDDAQVSTTITASSHVGETLTYTIRAENLYGFLSRPATIHFKVGYGIVDDAGAVIKDTVVPGSMGRVRLTRSKTKVVLHWAAVPDLVGLRGYRVSAPGMRAIVVTGTTTTLPLARLRGKTVSIAAVDQAGNSGRAATITVRL